MMNIDDVVAVLSALQRSELEGWIRDELITPQTHAGELLFTEMDYARVRLICTLRHELEIDEQTLPLVLSLIDQLYDTRRQLRSLAAAVTEQGKSVQAAVIAAVAAHRE